MEIIAEVMAAEEAEKQKEINDRRRAAEEAKAKAEAERQRAEQEAREHGREALHAAAEHVAEESRPDHLVREGHGARDGDGGQHPQQLARAPGASARFRVGRCARLCSSSSIPHFD